MSAHKPSNQHSSSKPQMFSSDRRAGAHEALPPPQQQSYNNPPPQPHRQPSDIIDSDAQSNHKNSYRRATSRYGGVERPRSPMQAKVGGSDVGKSSEGTADVGSQVRGQGAVRGTGGRAGRESIVATGKKASGFVSVLDGDYDLLDIIGEGSFGHVYEAKCNRTGRTVAIKKFKNKYQNKKKAFDQREIQILQKFEERDRRSQIRGRLSVNNTNQTPVSGHCPFVMKAERIQLENRRLYIVFERMDLSLTQWIKKKGRRRKVKLNEDTEIRVIMKQILTGLQYLHDDLGIMHRDLKPDNIMINENPLIARIIDFGTCKDLTIEGGPHTSYVSTRWYRAPECVLRSHHYNFVSDVFAAGCIMGELYLQQPLFPGSSELDQIDKILRILGTPLKENWREGYKLAEKRKLKFQNYAAKNLGQYLPGISEEALDVIQQMLRFSGHNRATAAHVLSLPFFRSPVFTPSSQDSHFIKSANMSQSPPNNMQNYLKQSSVMTKNMASESESRAQRRVGAQVKLADKVRDSQRDLIEQSLNFSTNHRQQYNNTESGERGPILTNDESGAFYSTKKSRDQQKEQNIYHFPINRKLNKGSTSLVGGNHNFSSRDSSTGTASNINQTSRPNIRAGYDSQVRGHFSQLPQITQARGTIYKNNYNKNNSSSNTNSGGAFVNTNSSLSPKQMDQTTSQMSQGAASTELGRTKLSGGAHANLTTQKMPGYNRPQLHHNLKSTAPPGIRQNFNDAFDAIAVHDDQQKKMMHLQQQRGSNDNINSQEFAHQSSFNEHVSFRAVRHNDLKNNAPNNRVPQSMIAPYKSHEFQSVLSPSRMDSQKRTTFFRKNQYNPPINLASSSANFQHHGSSPHNAAGNQSNVNLQKMNSFIDDQQRRGDRSSYEHNNSQYRSPSKQLYQQQNQLEQISPRMKVSLVQNPMPISHTSQILDPSGSVPQSQHSTQQQFVYKQPVNRQVPHHYNFSNQRGSFMDQRDNNHQESHSMNQSPANHRRPLRQYKNDEQFQAQSSSYGNFLSSERPHPAVNHQFPTASQVYYSPKQSNLQHGSFNNKANNGQTAPFFNYVEPQKPTINKNRMQINPNFDTNNHIQKTYVSPIRQSPDQRALGAQSSVGGFSNHGNSIISSAMSVSPNQTSSGGVQGGKGMPMTSFVSSSNNLKHQSSFIPKYSGNDLNSASQQLHQRSFVKDRQKGGGYGYNPVPQQNDVAGRASVVHHPNHHHSIVSTKEKDYRQRSGIGGGLGHDPPRNYRSPPPMKQYFNKEDESMEEIDMTMVGGSGGDEPALGAPASVANNNNINYSQSDLFGHSGYLGGAGYGPSVASSVFVSEAIGPGMKAAKSAFNKLGSGN